MALDDNALEKLAMQEILKEAKRNADRAKEMGSLGWQKKGIPSTNKRFLSNMLVSTLRNPLRHRKRQQSSDSDREGQPSHSRRRRTRSRSRESSENSRHRRTRSHSRSNSDEDDKHRKRRSQSHEASDDRYRKRRHSSEGDNNYRHEKYRPYGHKHNVRFFPRGRGRGQGRGFQHRNFHRNGEFPASFPGEDMDGFYHTEYMEYMNNYKKHMAFYDFMENEMDEKSGVNFEDEDSFSSFADSDISNDSTKNSNKEKKKKKKSNADKNSKEDMTVEHREKKSDEIVAGNESVSKKRKNEQKDSKSRDKDKRIKKKMENSMKKDEKSKEKESSRIADGKRSWKYERTERREATHGEEKVQEDDVDDEFNAENYRTNNKKASELEKNSSNNKTEISGSRNMDVYKKLNSEFSKKCKQNSTTDGPEKKIEKHSESKDNSEDKNDNPSLSEGEILDSDEEKVQQDADTSKNRKAKKRKHSKHRKHKHKKHKRK